MQYLLHKTKEKLTFVLNQTLNHYFNIVNLHHFYGNYIIFTSNYNE